MKSMSRWSIVGLVLLVALGAVRVSGQENGRVPYGSNEATGHYLQAGDAKIYYEIYGSRGTTLVLLHGGLYGYIEEFGDLIGELSKTRRVIAIATRGHGKSEIGKQDFSYELFADDALAVIRQETQGKVDVLGFSDGAITSYTFAAKHPELVRKLVAIGGPRGLRDWSLQAQKELRESKPTDVERDSPGFVADRKKLMPEPQRWIEFNEKLNKMWAAPVYVIDEQIKSIQSPTLVIAGDHDPYNQLEKFVETYKMLPHGEITLIPGCGHVVLSCKAKYTIEAVQEFLDANE